jgi:DNA-binding XRE family transcriptional regulator
MEAVNNVAVPVLKGDKLREMRKAKGMTPTQLAAAVGVSAQAINRFEDGLKDPSLRLFKKIAETVGASYTDLI